MRRGIHRYQWILRTAAPKSGPLNGFLVSLRPLSLALAGLLLAAHAAASSSTPASIEGSVRTSDGVVLPHVAVTLEGPSGSREIPIGSFFTGPEVDPSRENVIAPGKVLTSVAVPAPPSGWRGSYRKSRERSAGDFAIVSLAVGYELRGGRMGHVRVVLGGVAPTPLRSTAAEAVLEGNEPAEPLAAAAADAALAGAVPLSHNAFKLDLARALIVRGVMRLALP